jgi:predicted nucleic acid-binding protein
VADIASPEVILCDSSFFGYQERALVAPATVAHWAASDVARVDAAILAISVIALAEIRAGRAYANWGPKRCDAQDARMAAFLAIPLDDKVVDEYVALHAWSLKGHQTPHNDLWIAATALARGLPLASCDKHFQAIARDHGLVHIYFPARP